MICVADVVKHFEAIVLFDPPSTTTQRIDLVAETWEAARSLLRDRFGPNSIVDLLCVEEAERPRR